MLVNRLHTIVPLLLCAVMTFWHAGNAYTYGILPNNADIDTVKKVYQEWKELVLTTDYVADPETMLRPDNYGMVPAEMAALALLLAAYFEETEDVFLKIWNFTQTILTREGLVEKNSMANMGSSIPLSNGLSSLNADMDVALALDRAAIRWPDSPMDYDRAAQLYLTKILQYKVDPVTFVPTEYGKVYPYKIGFAYFRRFLARSGNDIWKTIVGKTASLLVPSQQQKFVFPSMMITATGQPVVQMGSSYFGLDNSTVMIRYGMSGLILFDTRMISYATEINSFFADAGARTGIDSSIHTLYTCDSGTVLQQGPSVYTVGAAGMAACIASDQQIADNAWNWLLGNAQEDKVAETYRLFYLLALSGGFMLSDTIPGKYPPIMTVNTPASGQFFGPGTAVEFNITIEERSGALDKIEIYLDDATDPVIEIPGVSGSTEYTYLWNDPPEGLFTITIIASDVTPRGSTPYVIPLLIGDPGSVIPYRGAPITIPDTLRAYEYDNGGDGIAYHDNDEKNFWNLFRTKEGVDLHINEEVEGITTHEDSLFYLYIGMNTVQPDTEWVQWTIEVPVSDTYDIIFSYAYPEAHTESDPKKVAVAIDDFRPDDLTGWQGDTLLPLTTPPVTGNWFHFQEYEIENVYLSEGLKRLRWYSLGINLWYIRIGKDLEIGVSPRNATAKQPAFEPVRWLADRGLLRISGINRISNVQVFDVAGRLCGALHPGTKAESVLDLSRIGRGTYIVAITDIGGNRSIRRIMYR